MAALDLVCARRRRAHRTGRRDSAGFARTERWRFCEPSAGRSGEPVACVNPEISGLHPQRGFRAPSSNRRAQIQSCGRGSQEVCNSFDDLPSLVEGHCDLQVRYRAGISRSDILVFDGSRQELLNHLIVLAICKLSRQHGEHRLVCVVYSAGMLKDESRRGMKCSNVGQARRHFIEAELCKVSANFIFEPRLANQICRRHRTSKKQSSASLRRVRLSHKSPSQMVHAT